MDPTLSIAMQNYLSLLVLPILSHSLVTVTWTHGYGLVKRPKPLCSKQFCAESPRIPPSDSVRVSRAAPRLAKSCFPTNPVQDKILTVFLAPRLSQSNQAASIVSRNRLGSPQFCRLHHSLPQIATATATITSCRSETRITRFERADRRIACPLAASAWALAAGTAQTAGTAYRRRERPGIFPHLRVGIPESPSPCLRERLDLDPEAVLESFREIFFRKKISRKAKSQKDFAESEIRVRACPRSA
jgi:hypothetical protein